MYCATPPTRGIATLLFLVAATLALGTQALADSPPRIAIIIDDLGYQRAAGERAIALPGDVAFAILPETPHARHLAAHARAASREVLLHLPMAAEDPDAPMDPGGIGPSPDRDTLEAALRRGLAGVPYAVGVNNHMGSGLTREPEPMAWLMEELSRLGWLYFVDSRTTHHSVAADSARAAGVPVLSRDVFLDADPSPEAVEREFLRLVALAHRNGQAVAIGHPYPDTLALLERELPRLAEAHGVTLVAPGRLLPRGFPEDTAPWPAYSSR